MRLVTLTTILFLFVAAWAAAQTDEGIPPVYLIPDEYVQIHKSGEQALLEGKFGEALRYFKRVLKKFPDFPPALRSAGACHELMNEFEDAQAYYEAALNHNPRFSRAMYYECGNISYKCGKYKHALKYFQTFDSLKALDFKAFTYNGIEERDVENEYYDKLSSSIRACHVAIDSIQFWNIPSIKNLGGSINTKDEEYFPFLTNDGNSIFYTSREDAHADENLFLSHRPTGEWRIGEAVKSFNSDENEGMTTLVRDGRRMFFTACQSKGLLSERPEVLGTCDIWQGVLDGNDVKDIKPVIGYANSGSWESEASVSCDGSLLFFASNREGGLGGTDIWVSERMPDARWGEPLNLGDKINTTGDEEAPFITNDGKVLYFSSTGYLGLGEQDIFMSRKDDAGQWSFPVNLGIPVNSSYRELGFFLSADGRTGYFASNRPGGYGGMDIYEFQLPEQLFSDAITYLEGYVKDSITHLPIRTTVSIQNRPAVNTDEDGRFFLCAKAGDTLRVEVRADDYHPYRNFFFVPQWDNRSFFHLDLLLDPLFRLPVFTPELAEKGVAVSRKSNLENAQKHIVLFEFDKADLKLEMMQELDHFLSETLVGKTIQTLEIVGYADDLGADGYNLVLSEKRAKAIGVYLKEKGIRVDKIYIEGKGESGDSRSRRENRKVEVVVHLTQ